MLNELERELINRYQGNVPLTEHPYAEMAQQIGVGETVVLNTLRGLLQNGTLTRFGPLYDATLLGGGLTLAAMAVPEQQFEEVSRQVNAFTEVAHNYRRDHTLNMWFVLATDHPAAIQQTLDTISAVTGLPVYNFPKQREFYIGLQLQLSADGSATTVPVERDDSGSRRLFKLGTLSHRIIRQTQAGLPLETTPYHTVADAIGSNQSEVIQQMKDMLRCGMIRRIGAVPNHYRLGIRANGMSVWDVDDRSAIRAGEAIGQLDFVSHCYLRPRQYPVWRYNLFAMVHGHSRDEVSAKVAQISHLLGSDCRAGDILFSTAILKKTGMRISPGEPAGSPPPCDYTLPTGSRHA